MLMRALLIETTCSHLRKISIQIICMIPVDYIMYQQAQKPVMAKNWLPRSDGVVWLFLLLPSENVKTSIFATSLESSSDQRGDDRSIHPSIHPSIDRACRVSDNNAVRVHQQQHRAIKSSAWWICRFMQKLTTLWWWQRPSHIGTGTELLYMNR